MPAPVYDSKRFFLFFNARLINRHYNEVTKKLTPILEPEQKHKRLLPNTY